MSKFKLEKFASKKIGKKYVFSQHEGDNWAGPSIEHYPAINTTKLGVYTEDGKYKFELKLNNTEGTDYTIRVCNKEGYPIGLTMVVSNGCLYFGKFSSREGFNGTVYRFKKDENVRIQKYSHGLLLDECVHEYVVKTNVAYPLPFECLVEAGETIERKVSNKKGDFIEFIAGNPNSRIRVLGASIDGEGSVTIGQYRDDGFSGLAMKYLPDGMTYLRTFTNGTPDGEFEFLYNSGELNGVTVNGYAIVVKKDDEAGYLDLIYCEKNGKISMQAMELTQKRKPIKESMIDFPLDVDPNAPKPTVKAPKPVTPPKDKSTGEEKLNKLIGLESVKKEIKKMKAIFHKFKTTPDKANLNMVFYGNPGTGKTEVARIIADILHEEGLLPTNKCVETDSSGLIAEYVGQTGPKTHEIVQKAMGGVLFIDEAYMLSSGTHKGGSFGEEAITALLKDMEDYRGKLCIILAGYKEPMEKMMEINPGFTSRINRYIDFPDYSLDELRQIALLMYKNKGYDMEDKALDETIKVLSTFVNNPNFANAREVRNLLESIYEIQALRTSEDPNNMLITLADVKEYEKDHNITFGTKSTKKKIKWNIDPEEFINLAQINYDYKFDNSYIEEASVNIKCFNEGKSIGEGSGFFISPKGIIGTCAHVVNGADKILVYVNIKTASGQTINKDYVADVISMDVKSDVALIGIINPEIIFPYYPLPLPQSGYPTLMTEIAMGGYPFGGDRFEKITLTEGKVQSINKDNAVGDDIVKLFVDISGQPGSSGSGVINKNNGKCIGVFAGAVIHNTGTLKLTINYAVPIDYLWNLIYNIKPIEVLESSTIVEKFKTVKSKNVIYNEDCLYNESISHERRRNGEYGNIHIVKGDVSTFVGDAVVNAANKYLAPGAGVCGAIFDRAGYRELQNECMRIGGCEVGNAVITNGYNLKANYIIHAVGPHYLHDEYPDKLLESVYENVFKVAIKHNIKSIALPSISTGIFKFPLERAVPIALKVIKKYADKMDDIYVYCYGKDDSTYDAYIRFLNK